MALHGQTITCVVPMNVIIVAKFLRTPRNFCFSQTRTRVVCAAGLLALLGCGAGIGYAASFVTGNGGAQALAFREQIEQQRDALDAARGDAQRELNAMAIKLAELQAQATRLNALGERLTKIARLDDGEFNFAEAPAVGGPRVDAAAEGPSGVALQSSIDDLDARLSMQSEQLLLLESLLSDRDLDAALLPTGLPVRSGYASSGFGTRADPFSGYSAFHRGVDFNGPRGSDVLTVAEGVVYFAGKRSGYGNVVEIDHGNGYRTLYAHNQQNLVKEGERVKAGDVIAKMGSTGRATGSHVHFEVWLNGKVVNPNQYLRNARG